MTDNKKISCIQLAVLLIMSRLFSEAVNFPLVNTEYGMQRFAVILTAYAILFVLYAPLLYLSKKYPGESAASIIINRYKWLGWLYAVLIAVSVLTASISSMCRMRFYASSTIFGQAPPVLLILLILFVCGFTAWKGIQAAARSGVIFAALFVGFLVLIAVSVWGLCDVKWLYNAFIENGNEFVKQVMEQIGSNTEIIFFSVLAENVTKKTHRTIIWYVPAVMIILELMFLLEMLVLGPFLSNVSFPFFTVSALSNIVLFQRLDGIDVAVWTFMCIIKISLALICIKTLFGKLAGKKTGMWAAAFSLAAIAAVSIGLGGNSAFVEWVTGILTNGIPMLICGVLFPITAIIIRKCKGK